MTTMIVLDTNVVSELMRPRENPTVLDWIDRQKRGTLAITSITYGELLFGIAVRVPGKRQRELNELLNGFLETIFQQQILGYDREAAHEYARIVAGARSRGIAISVPDGQIAAVAAAHGFTVATRDTGPFDAAGVRVVNPWVEAAS